MNPVIVLTTVGADFNVGPMAHDLVERRLAACVNIVERVQSIYRWEGQVTEEREQLLIIKTTDARVDELREALIAQHPYDTPEFVVVPISAVSDSYGEWLLRSVEG